MNNDLGTPLHQYILEFSVLVSHCLEVGLHEIRIVALEEPHSPENAVQSLDREDGLAVVAYPKTSRRSEAARREKLTLTTEIP